MRSTLKGSKLFLGRQIFTFSVDPIVKGDKHFDRAASLANISIPLKLKLSGIHKKLAMERKILFVA